MTKNYPATKSGLRRMGRDMQKEIEKGMKPVNVPVRYQYRTGPRGITASPWANSTPSVTNNHYGDVVSVDGDHNLVAFGNEGPVHQNAGQHDERRMALLAALGNVHSHLDELDLGASTRPTTPRRPRRHSTCSRSG